MVWKKGFVKEVQFLTMETQNTRIAKMPFSSVYPMCLAKVQKKGKTEEELAKGRKIENIQRK